MSVKQRRRRSQRRGTPPDHSRVPRQDHVRADHGLRKDEIARLAAQANRPREEDTRHGDQNEGPYPVRRRRGGDKEKT